MTTEPLTYKVDEVAKMLRIGRKQAYQAVERGDIPSLKIGRRWVISRTAFQKWLEGGGNVLASKEG